MTVAGARRFNRLVRFSSLLARFAPPLARFAPLLACFALLLPASASASFAGGDGVIAYAAQGSIWAIDPATGDQRQLTAGYDDSAPSFSPSGNMLAFQRYAQGAVTVYVAQADGASPSPLVEGREPAFSPDGRQIVFVRPDGLYLTGVAPGSPVTRLTHDPGDREPSWSAGGAIAFVRTSLQQVKDLPHSDSGAVVRFDEAAVLDTIVPGRSAVHQVLSYAPGASSGTLELWPDWSPAGTTLAVSLCTPLPLATQLLQGRPPALPAVYLRQSCARQVFSPAGQGFAQAGAGVLAGQPETSCPAVAEAASLAWQPLVAGTEPVATAPCVSTPPEPPPPGAPVMGVAATALIRGTELCISYSPRLHRRVCFEP